MKLTDYLKEYGDELKEGYEEMDLDDLDEFREKVDETRKDKVTAIRDKPKARLRDVDNTFNNMKREVSRF